MKSAAKLLCGLLMSMATCAAWPAPPDQPSTAPVPAVAGGDPQAAAAEVFSQPEYWWKKMQQLQGVDIPAPPLGPVGRALGWLFHQIGRFLHLLFHLLRMLMPSGDPFGYANLARALLLAAALSVVVLVALRWRELRQWLGAGSKGSRTGIGHATSEVLPDAARLMAEAAAALARGEAQAAIRLAFRGVLAGLEIQGLIPSHRARTNRELIDTLRRSTRAPGDGSFRALALSYENVCYGQHPISDADAQAYLSRCGALLDQSRRQPT